MTYLRNLTPLKKATRSRAAIYEALQSDKEQGQHLELQLGFYERDDSCSIQVFTAKQLSCKIRLMDLKDNKQEHTLSSVQDNNKKT